MSVIAYGGVNLSYVLTQSVEQSPVFDPSGTDQLLTKTLIKVQAVVNAGCLPSNVGETPRDTVARIRHYLTLPRQSLVFNPGSGVGDFLRVPNGDDHNGPKPVMFGITQVTPSTFIVSWGVEVYLTDCTGAASRGYLGLKWSETVNYDKNWYCVRRKAGYLILSSQGAASGDDMRGVVTPDCPAGFVREQAQYGYSEDGLTWRFEFVDRQKDKMPPFPATEMKGRMVESVPLKGGQRRGELHLALTGPPGIPARELLNAAIKVAMNRIWASDPQTYDAGKVMVGGAVAESLDDDRNAVELHLTWNMKVADSRESGKKPFTWRGVPHPSIAGLTGWLAFNLGVNSAPTPPAPTPEGKDKAALPITAAWVGRPLAGSDPSSAIAPPLRGLAERVRLVAAVLNDPCGQNAVLEPGGFEDNDLVGVSDSSSVVVSQLSTAAQQPDDDQALYTADDGPGAWESWVMTAHYSDDTGRDVLPAAVPGGKGKLVQMHGRSLSLKYEWSLERDGGRPTWPKLVTMDDENWKYISGGLSLDNLDAAADGVSVTYTAAGWWLYKSLDPDNAVVAYPIPPFLQRNLLADQSVLSTSGGIAPDSEWGGGGDFGTTNQLTAGSGAGNPSQ